MTTARSRLGALTLSLGDTYELGTREFTSLDLFLFSAAGWHPHRIHFDLPYAESEGHRALVVHGPLQAVHLFQALAERLPDRARVTRTAYRHRAPLFVGTKSGMFATVTGESGSEVNVELWFEDENRRRTTTGTAVVQRDATST